MTTHAIDADPTHVVYHWTYGESAQPLTIAETIRTATGEVIASEPIEGHLRGGHHIELGAA